MRLIRDVSTIEAELRQAIKKFGYTPDHNFDWCTYCTEHGQPAAALWEDGSAVWCYFKEKEWIVLSDPIAPLNKKVEKMHQLTDYLFNKTEKITFLDVREPIADACRKLNRWRYEPDYELVWPVLNMEKYDPDFPGGHYKTIRNALRKFNKEHKVDVTPASGFDPVALHDLVDRWHQHRLKAGIEELNPQRYHRMIDHNFRGTESARVMLVDDQVVGLNAGWETPNQPDQWSAAIGLHDFSSKDLGLILLIEDLNWIKRAGFRSTDLEGSESQPLRFKMQFLPELTYKTLSFSLLRS